MRTVRERINNDYFEWMYALVCNERYSDRISYRKLFTYLHNTEFIFSIPRDVNRAMDGIGLRRRYSLAENREDMLSGYLKGPCSVLEMMVSLAIRMEETIMDDPEYGNRTGQWFWSMIGNLGLGMMTDDQFDESYVENSINRFMERKYKPDGSGGLFRIRHAHADLRKVEIWTQMSWYLDELI